MMGEFRELIVYKKAFKIAIEIFERTKGFPKHEQYSLTDQIRRSSRSVCTNIGEAYRKRRYSKYFISKISDSDSENTETQIWLDFSLECQYLNQETYDSLLNQTKEIGRLLNYMINNPKKFE